MDFDDNVHSCVTINFHFPERSLVPLSSPFPHSPRGNSCSDFYKHILVLPVLERNINAIGQYVGFCDCLPYHCMYLYSSFLLLTGHPMY